MRHPALVKRALCIDAWLFSLDRRILCIRGSCPLPKDVDLLFIDAEFSSTEQSRSKCCTFDPASGGDGKLTMG